MLLITFAEKYSSNGWHQLVTIPFKDVGRLYVNSKGDSRAIVFGEVELEVFGDAFRVYDPENQSIVSAEMWVRKLANNFEELEELAGA